MTHPFEALPRAQFTFEDVVAGRLAQLQAAMYLEYGPIFRWILQDSPVGSGDFIHMVGPDANRFVLHTGREHFSHDQGWTPIIGEGLGKGLLNMDAPEHTRHRKLWNPAFTAAAMEAYLPMIEQVIAERTRCWPDQADVDVLEAARTITFDVAAHTLAGLSSGAALDELRHLFAQQDRADAVRRDQIMLDLIAERRSRPPHAAHTDVVSMIVHARDEHNQPLDDRQIIAHINILLVAGHETTTVLSAWALYLLATLPHQRQRIEAELNALAGDTSAPLTVEALRQMKQLDWFIKEVGRLYAPVLNVPRGVVRPFEFGGYAVPAGTQVRLALAAGHLLPHVFAAPHQFDPERFAPPREEDRRTPYGLVTFGGGARICIGLNFATVETKALVAYVLRQYRLEAVNDGPIVHAGALLGSPDRPPRLNVQHR